MALLESGLALIGLAVLIAVPLVVWEYMGRKDKKKDKDHNRIRLTDFPLREWLNPFFVAALITTYPKIRRTQKKRRNYLRSSDAIEAIGRYDQVERDKDTERRIHATEIAKKLDTPTLPYGHFVISEPALESKRPYYWNHKYIYNVFDRKNEMLYGVFLKKSYAVKMVESNKDRFFLTRTLRNPAYSYGKRESVDEDDYD